MRAFGSERIADPRRTYVRGRSRTGLGEPERHFVYVRWTDYERRHPTPFLPPPTSFCRQKARTRRTG